MSDEQHPADGGTATSEPSTNIDNPENWNFADSDEDQNIPETTAERAADETDETTEVDQEAEESKQDDPTEETDEDSEEAEKAGKEQSEDVDDEADAPATIKLKSGEQITLDEAVDGYMRNADFTRKSQANAESRKTLEAQSNRLERTVEVFTEYLANQIPSPPDASLALSDAGAYTAQKAFYDQQVAQIQQLIEFGGEPKAIKGELSTNDHQTLVQRETELLHEKFPTTSNPKGYEAFFAKVFEAGATDGFSKEEMASVTDHRVLSLAHDAYQWRQVQKAKAKAKAKVVEAPKAAPKKQAAVPGTKARKNADAMKRLGKSGSIHDALHVDWD